MSESFDQILDQSELWVILAATWWQLGELELGLLQYVALFSYVLLLIKNSCFVLPVVTRLFSVFGRFLVPQASLTSTSKLDSVPGRPAQVQGLSSLYMSLVPEP